MSKGLPNIVRFNIDKCRDAAIAAVEAYNRPGRRFRTAQYIVMITIAWTALFHAVFYKRGRRPWYRKRTAGGGIRYVKVDGEPRHWELAECLNEYFAGNHPPERKNIEFLIGIRNKIEHRHLPEFDISLYGECQATLLNLEEILTQEFGNKYALAEDLAVSLQFSTRIPSEKAIAARKLAAGASKTVKDYIEQFRGNLAPAILNSMKYSFSVFLVPKVANRQSAADVAVQFVRVDEASEEELQRLQRLNVLIKEKYIPIANLDLHKPGQVVAQISRRIPFSFTMTTHTSAWRHFKVRPASGSANPERTLPQYCIYDPVHKDYVYTKAWIEKLATELSQRAIYDAVLAAPTT